jgi:hypothetical protein
MIPGSNILNAALRVIASTPVQYYKYVTRAANDLGIYNTLYDPPIQIRGSLQAVEKTMYAQLGLDLSKKYMNLFVPNNILDVNRDVSGDQFIYNSETYQCESAEPWFSIDGWTAILAVKVPLSPFIGLNNA